MSRHKIALLLLMASLLLLSACARKGPSKELVAVINEYRMTVEDYNYESKEVLQMGKLLGEMPSAKEEILDALITKELLLQEAQRLGLDKDKSFMRTIELYWEQTLIKNLMAKQSKEIEQAIAVNDFEIERYHNKMRQRIRAKVIVCGDEQMGRKLLRFEGDIAQYAKMKPEGFSLKYIIPSKYYTLGDDITELEYKICSIDSKLNRAFVQVDNDWALVLVEERIPIEPLPLVVVRNEIISNIRNRKEKMMVEEWFRALRAKARIKIFENVLNELQ